mgnify:FL=1
MYTEILKNYIQAWLDVDSTVVEKTFAENAVYTECYGPRYCGRLQIMQWFADWNQKGCVLEWTVKRSIEQGNIAVAEWYFSYRYDGEVGSFDGVTVAEFDEAGKILRLSEYESKAEHEYPYGIKKTVDFIEVNGRKYEIIRLLGKGKGGYSYLAQKDGRHVVVKQIHHEPCDYYQFGNKIQAEINDYKRLSAIGISMPQMLDVDIENERIVKEYIAGDTVYELVRKEGLPETCLQQVKQMCKLLYAAKTNIDYFPTNFILQNGILYYVDYECNDYMEEWNFENWGCKYWSKTPEFIEYTESVLREAEK